MSDEPRRSERLTRPSLIVLEQRDNGSLDQVATTTNTYR